MGNVHMEATQINYRGGASKMNVEEAIKSAIELTPEQKTNINKIPTIEAAVGTKTDQAVIAPEFDAEAGVYAVGDLVMHEGKLYEFTSAHETAGDWNSEEVSEKTVSDELDTLKSGLTNKQDKTDYELETTAKTVVGGINELKNRVKVIEVTTSDTVDQATTVKVPSGYDALSAVIVGYTAQRTNNLWYNSDDHVNVGMYSEYLYVVPKNADVLEQTVKVVLIKISA